MPQPSRCWGLGRVEGSARFWTLDAGDLGLEDSAQTRGGRESFSNFKFLNAYVVPPQIRSKGLLTVGNYCATLDAVVRSP